MSGLTRYGFDPGRADQLGAMIQPARAIEIAPGHATVAGIVLDVPGDLAPGTYSIDQLLRAAGDKAESLFTGAVDVMVDAVMVGALDEIRRRNRWDARLPEVRDWRRRQGGR